MRRFEDTWVELIGTMLSLADTMRDRALTLRRLSMSSEGSTRQELIDAARDSDLHASYLDAYAHRLQDHPPHERAGENSAASDTDVPEQIVELERRGGGIASRPTEPQRKRQPQPARSSEARAGHSSRLEARLEQAAGEQPNGK